MYISNKKVLLMTLAKTVWITIYVSQSTQD